MAGEDGQVVQQQVAEVAGVQDAQALLVQAVERLAPAVGELAGLARRHAGRASSRGSSSGRSGRPGRAASSAWRRCSAASISCLSSRSWSSVSRMVKLDFSPTSSAWRRRIWAATEWKVPSQRRPSACGADDVGDPLAHLARGLVGEGDDQQLPRPGPAGGQDVGQAGGQHPRSCRCRRRPAPARGPRSPRRRRAARGSAPPDSRRGTVLPARAGQVGDARSGRSPGKSPGKSDESKP